MVLHHLSTVFIVTGLILVSVGTTTFTMHLFCSYVKEVRECSIVGAKPFLIFPGLVALAGSFFLFRHKDESLSDVDSILRYHEIDSHCPRCYTQGVVKKSGFFTNKMLCPKCRREWRILDL